MATDKELAENTKDFLSSDRNKSTADQVLDLEGKPIDVGWCYFIRTFLDGKFVQYRIVGNVFDYMRNRNLKPEECMLIPQSWFERKRR
jgi:hypothetical protein